MTKETKKLILKLIQYSIAFLPIFSGGLLLVFGDASDFYSKMIFGLSVLVTVPLVVYNKEVDNPNPDPLYKTEPRFVDLALIVSLWVFGAIGVLFSGLFTGWALHLEIYFQTTAALAVMYVLLVAFRINRLVRRTDEEEELTLDLMGKALYWRTIYKRDVEAVVGRWKDLPENMRGKIEELLIEKKEKYEDKVSEILEKEGDEGLAEEIVKELAEIVTKELVEKLQLKDPSLDPPKENVEAAVAIKKKGFRRLITDECAKDLFAGKVITEVMEKINKDKFDENLSNSYRVSMQYIDSIEEWEIEKVSRPAQEMEKLKLQTNHQEREKEWEQERAKFRRWEQEQEIEIEKAKLDMLNMDEDKLQEWEQENAKFKRQEQEWKIKKAEFKRREQEWEEENAKIQELEKEKANHQKRTDEGIVKLNEIKSDFTKFINSRQHGNNPSELIMTGGIGVALVALMHLGFPEVITGEVTTEGITKVITERITGVGAFSIHLFALFTSTIVVFLFCNIIDLEKDRHRSLHDVGPDNELWKEPKHRIYMSPGKTGIIIVSVFTTIVYVLLLWDKLVSPFPFLY